MKHYITIALCTFLSQTCTGQVMMLFSQDSLTGIVSPLDVDSLFYWFAADVGVTDSLGGAIATDEGVGTWNDLSGNGYHVTQSTDGARPVWKATGGPGGYPCIQFDGTDDFLASAAHFWGSDDLTVFVVMKFANATRDANEWVLSKYETTSPSNNRSYGILGQNIAGSYQMRFNSTTDGAATIRSAEDSAKSSSWTLWALLSNGTTDNHKWYKDAVAQSVSYSDSPSSIFDSALTKFGIGAVNVTGTASAFLQGSISEIIIYSKELSATERTAIENYLNRKHDLY